MSNRFNLTDEEINRVLLSSPYTLPSSPAQKGLSESQIKKYFYNFIVLLCEKLNVHFSDIAVALLELLSKIDTTDLTLSQKAEALSKEITSTIALHNEEATAHTDIRELISKTADEICELILQGINEHNNSSDVHRSLKELIVQSIDEHNMSPDVHQSLKELIVKAQETADSAHNLASGKSKVYPVRSIAEMDYLLSSAYTDCFVGDVFVIAEKGVPDFTVYERETEAKDGDVSFSQFDLLMGMEFTPGTVYYASSSMTRLIASESGMDTSLLATRTELEQKQDKLIFDEAPQPASDSPVTSNGIALALADAELRVKEYAREKADSLKAKRLAFTNGTTVAVTDNTIYISSEPINELIIEYPNGDFICSLEFALADEGDITISLPPESKFIGRVPTFANGETWELNIRNGVIVGGIVE